MNFFGKFFAFFLRRSIVISLFCVFVSVLAGCANKPVTAGFSTQGGATSVQTNANPQQNVLILSPGDRLRINVFGDQDISGEYDIDGRGFITMPLVGELEAGGKAVPAVKAEIVERLSQGFLVNPRVSIEVISLRPFYILGEVRTPGSYPTFPGFDVFKAIATAGGLTPRAVKNDYILYRGFGENRRKFKATDETPVFPGDSIRVRERFF